MWNQIIISPGAVTDNNHKQDEEEQEETGRRCSVTQSRTHTSAGQGRGSRRHRAARLTSNTTTRSHRGGRYLVPCHGAHNERTDHSREGSHSIGDAHENAGVTRGNVQVVDVET